MKKMLLLSALFSCVCLVAQHKVAKQIEELQSVRTVFKPMSVLTVSNQANPKVDKALNSATSATLKIDKLNEIVAAKYEYLELEIPFQNQTVSVLLYKVNPFAEGFHLDTDKGKNVAYQKGVFYRGIIKGDDNSVASFSFFNGEFNGIFSSTTLGNIVVGKLKEAGNQTKYVVYSDAQLKVLNQFDCHVKEDAIAPKSTTKTNKNTLSDRCVTVYFEIDHNLFLQNNSDITTTTNWMTSVFNNVQTLYNNDGITVGLKSMFIWTTPDPYQGQQTGSTANSGHYLNAFGQYRPFFDGDVGQLVGIDSTNGGFGGVAVTIGGLCSQNNYSYSDINTIDYSTVPTYSWAVQVVTHELGHLLGSPHTHACVWNGNNTAIDNCGPYSIGVTGEGYSCMTTPPTIPSGSVKGTIMSYCHLVTGVGINFNNGFGPQPAALILSTVNSSQCLSLDCVNTCINMVADVTLANVTTTTASITWTDSSNTTSWEVSVTPFNATNIVWNTVTNTSFNASGLTPNTYYIVKVRPLCAAGVVSASRNKVIATTSSNFCDNLLFTDTGGATGDYTDLESWVRTMTPYNSGLKLKVTFSSFDIEQDWDYLYIYDGPDESYNDLTSGGITGSNNPGVFNSTAADGSLTFKFESDQGTVAAGWEAVVTCTGTLGVESNDYLDFSYYPNPTNGKVTISSKDAISQVLVYNLQGQLLYNQTLNDLNTTVDIASFAQGTYFFKLKFNDKEANFKVLKM